MVIDLCTILLCGLDLIYTYFCKIFVTSLILSIGILSRMNSGTIKKIVLKLNDVVQYNEIYKEAVKQTIEYGEDMYRTEKVTLKFFKKIGKKFVSVSTGLMYKKIKCEVVETISDARIVSQKTRRNIEICVNVLCSMGKKELVSEKVVKKVGPLIVSNKLREPMMVVENHYVLIDKEIIDDWEMIY